MQPWDRNLDGLFDGSDNVDMIDAVCAFSPLQFLCLRGLSDVTSLRQILSQHGESLRGLILEVQVVDRWGHYYRCPSFLDGGQLTRELADKCPHLQELRLPIQRRQGSSQECSLYKALGKSFPNLHTLMLDLKYDPRRESAREDDPVATCLRESLINAAMDRELAIAIWKMISSSQPTQKLRNLRIRPFGSLLFSRAEKHVHHHVSSSFLITRSGPSSGPVKIEEIGDMAWDLWASHDIANRHLYLLKEVRVVLDNLWSIGPGKKGGQGWKEMNWKSFPLAG